MAAVQALLTRTPSRTVSGRYFTVAVIMGSATRHDGPTVDGGIKRRLTFVGAGRNSNYGRATHASQGQRKGSYRSLILHYSSYL